MDLDKIVAISGRNGLYRIVASVSNSLIMESLKEKKRIPVFSNEKVHILNDISIFTKKEDIPLAGVMDRIYEKEGGKQALDPASDPEALKKYMAEVLPDYDEARVYVSNIRKLLKWYNELQETGNLKLTDKKENEEEGKAEDKSIPEKITEQSLPGVKIPIPNTNKEADAFRKSVNPPSQASVSRKAGAAHRKTG